MAKSEIALSPLGLASLLSYLPSTPITEVVVRADSPAIGVGDFIIPNGKITYQTDTALSLGAASTVVYNGEKPAYYNVTTNLSFRFRYEGTGSLQYATAFVTGGLQNPGTPALLSASTTTVTFVTDDLAIRHVETTLTNQTVVLVRPGQQLSPYAELTTSNNSGLILTAHMIAKKADAIATNQIYWRIST